MKRKRAAYRDPESTVHIGMPGPPGRPMIRYIRCVWEWCVHEPRPHHYLNWVMGRGRGPARVAARTSSKTKNSWPASNWEKQPLLLLLLLMLFFTFISLREKLPWPSIKTGHGNLYIKRGCQPPHQRQSLFDSNISNHQLTAVWKC